MNSITAHSAAEDLALIRSMMEAGRQKAAFDGAHLVVWGAVLMVCYFMQYMQVFGYIPGTPLWIWLPAFAVGWGFSLLYRRGACEPASVPNIAVRAYNAAWLAVGITMLLHFGAAVVSGVFDAKAITVLACGVFACAFYVISIVTELRALRLASVGWWGVLVYATIQAQYDAEMLLVLAAASALLVLLPGQMMRRLANQHNTTAVTA